MHEKQNEWNNINLEDNIARLELLLKNNSPKKEEELTLGLGTRLALGIAKEMKDAKKLGSDTEDLIVTWIKQYGQDSVEKAIAISRSFLTKPDELKKGLEARLFG